MLWMGAEVWSGELIVEYASVWRMSCGGLWCEAVDCIECGECRDGVVWCTDSCCESLVWLPVKWCVVV